MSGCDPMTTWVVEMHRRGALSRILQLTDASFQERNVLFEETRAGNLCSSSILAVVGSAVCKAAATGGFVTIAFLMARSVSRGPRLLSVTPDERRGRVWDQMLHTALSFRHGRQAAPLLRGRELELADEDILSCVCRNECRCGALTCF